MSSVLVKLASPSSSGADASSAAGTNTPGRSLSSLAAACWASLVVARGELSDFLAFVSSVLMSAHHLASEELRLPEVIVSLQLGLHALLTGSDRLASWFSDGVNDRCRLIETALPAALISGGPTSLACDGRFIYAHNAHGLHKLGSGYKGTVLGYLYASKANFRPTQRLWLGCARGQLLCAEVTSLNEGGGEDGGSGECGNEEKENDGRSKARKTSPRSMRGTVIYCVNTDALVEEKKLLLQGECERERAGVREKGILSERERERKEF